MVRLTRWLGARATRTIIFAFFIVLFILNKPVYVSLKGAPTDFSSLFDVSDWPANVQLPEQLVRQLQGSSGLDIDGRYLFVQQLGGRREGAVNLYQDTSTGNLVAIKQFHTLYRNPLPEPIHQALSAEECHNDVKPDNIYVEDELHWLLGDLGNVREINHHYYSTSQWHHEGQWADCQTNDLRRALISYLTLMRRASADTEAFDQQLMCRSSALAQLYWGFMEEPISAEELLHRLEIGQWNASTETFGECGDALSRDCMIFTFTSNDKLSIQILQSEEAEALSLVIGDVSFPEGHLAPQRGPMVPDQQHPIFALQKLLTESYIPHYCKTLSIGGFDELGRTIGNYRDHVAAEAARITRDLKDQLVALIETEPYHQFVDPSDYVDMDAGNHDLTCSVMLSSLRNIETLEIVNCSGFFQMLPVHYGMQDTHQHLKHVVLIRDPNALHYFEDLDLLHNLATIPSVRTIYGLYVRLGRGPGNTRDLQRQRPYSSVEEVHFERSNINVWDVDELLRSIERLKIFYCERIGSTLCDYAPRHILAILQQFASESLESLTMTDRNWARVETATPMLEGNTFFTGSLKEFKVLKHVAIEFAFLINEQRDGRVVIRGKTTSGDRVADGRTTAKWAGGITVPRLVDVLPSSLETLELYRPRKHLIDPMFLGLRELGRENLPNLRSILIQTNTRIKREIRETCQNLGIEVEFVEAPRTWWAPMDPAVHWPPLRRR
ncbi:MAG: hypothetical protein Q9221_008991 [Calogaya cf. arnoldii]